MAREVAVQIVGDSRDVERAFARSSKAAQGFKATLNERCRPDEHAPAGARVRERLSRRRRRSLRRRRRARLEHPGRLEPERADQPDPGRLRRAPPTRCSKLVEDDGERVRARPQRSARGRRRDRGDLPDIGLGRAGLGARWPRGSCSSPPTWPRSTTRTRPRCSSGSAPASSVKPSRCAASASCSPRRGSRRRRTRPGSPTPARS